ncbi:MAG TPA: hypothetical protein ENI66_00270 [Candidatus Yonathbacteria bacterium]|nr:hypothetical protein [Candidatus Yonathbacteria bacterium]
MNRSKIIIIIGVVALITLGACSLTSCGGGGGGGNGNNESGVVLPPVSGQPAETLAGEDVDPKDGVWDYIGTYIDKTQPNSEKARTALREYAKNLQAQLLDANDKELSVQHARKEDAYLACVEYIQGFEESVQTTDALIANLLNTDMRIKAYFVYDGQLAGGYDLVPVTASACNFDVDSLPN